MQITLEQVDQVIERTGATYKEAKEALEHTNGDVLEAIVYLEQEKSEPHHAGMAFGQDIINGIKDIVKKGNITSVTLEKDGRVLVDLPLTIGAIGAVFFAPATVVAVIAALATGCEMKIVKVDGEVINVKNITKDTLDQLKEKINQATKPADKCCDSCECEEKPEEQAEAKEEDIFEEEQK